MPKIQKFTSGGIQGLPNKGGVYEFADTRGRSIYIGKTDDIQRRTNEHYSDSEPNTCLKIFLKENPSCVFEYEIIANESAREEFEKMQIKEMQPKCNIQNNT